MAVPYEIGSQIRVKIKKLLITGLLVQLPDRNMGIVRTREISWRKEERHTWQKEFTIGRQVDAVVLHKRERFLELSLRLAEDDPWLRVVDHYQVGQLVEGVVTDVVAYGVFVEIAPAITGLLHKSLLPLGAAGKINDLLWTGDSVKVLIDSIDLKKRRIGLSMRDLRQHRWKTLDGEMAADDDSAKARPTTTPQPGMHHALARLAEQRPRSILLIEDDKTQRDAIGHWLQQAGQLVTMARTAEQGLALLDTRIPDLILSDVGLPGMNGIAATEHILHLYPGIHCVLMTDWARADGHQDEIRSLQQRGVHFLLKPLLPMDLLDLFTMPRDGGTGTRGNFGHASSGLSLPPDPVVRPNVPSGLEIRSTVTAEMSAIHHQLAKMQRATHAAKTVLFRLDMSQRQIQIVAERGRRRLHKNALAHLIHSPVRDVAEDQKSVCVEDVEQIEAYVRYLKPLLSFRSCVGVPLGQELPHPHALFLFFAEPNQITPTTEAFADATALALSATLEKHLFLARATEMQRDGLLGTFTRSLVHEVNHHLSPINFALESLRAKCEEVDRMLDDDPSRVRKQMSETAITLGYLSQGIANLARVARQFGRMTIQDQEGMIRVDQLVKNAVDLARDTIEETPIRITFRQPKQIFVTRCKATQIQQVVVNVLINALQQIERFRTRDGGHIHVWLARTVRGARTCIQIHVEDDGPGIHNRLWERIFEMGFSTRPQEGSGMGLYIARALVADIEGRIGVEESHMLWGTRMVIELPVRVT